MLKTYIPYAAPEARPSLLTVLAHPDDESFGSGGTLARYAWSGAAVHLVCATRGDVGHSTPELLQGYASLGERREAELDCAAQRLGLASVESLGYRDSGMPGTADNQHPQALAAQPQDEVVARVVQAIRRTRPQVVVTFDPIGGYRHPDHIAIHQATVAAFHAAGDPAAYPGELPPYQPQKLYYSTFSRWFLRLVVGIMPLFGKDPRRFGRNEDVDLASIATEDFPIHAEINYTSVAAHKAAAVECHVSQSEGPSLAWGIFAAIFRLLGDKDVFMQAYPAPNTTRKERDLFAGVTLDAQAQERALPQSVRS